MILRLRHRAGTGGLTLIELIVVIAIAGLLATIAIPLYGSYRERAHRAEATTALLRLRERQERWYLQFHTYTGDLEALGFSDGCSENCVYTIDFTITPDTTGFVARARPTPGGGRNDVDQTADAQCQWFTLSSLGLRDAGPGSRCW